MPGTSPATAPGKRAESDKQGGSAPQTNQNPAGAAPETDSQAANAPKGYRPPGDPSSSSGQQQRVPVPAGQETQGSKPQEGLDVKEGQGAHANPMVAKELYGPVKLALNKAAAAADSEGADEQAQALRSWSAQVEGWLGGGKAKL